MKIFIIMLLVPFLVYAEDYPYSPAEIGFFDTPGTKKEITPNSPVKSQDGIGICYGFTATSLLEHYRCKELNLNCNDPKELLSSFDVTSYYKKQGLREGGNTYRILSNIENGKDVRIAREECAKFSNLVYQTNVTSTTFYRDEKRGWNLLVQKWNEFRGLAKDVKRNDCVSCMVDEIKKELTYFETPAEQLKDAFNTALTLEDFLYKSILPTKCLDPSSAVFIPKFKAKTFPGKKEILNAENLSKRIQSLLLNDIPLEMGICSEVAVDGKCPERKGHSIALFGIKEVCRGNDCRVMVQVKNSWGKSWQTQNADGWMELTTLVESSLLIGKIRNINWIERPGFVLTEKTLRKHSTPMASTTVPSSSGSNGAGIPAQYKDHKGTWKCPGAKYVQNFEAGCVPYRP